MAKTTTTRIPDILRNCAQVDLGGELIATA